MSLRYEFEHLSLRRFVGTLAKHFTLIISFSIWLIASSLSLWLKDSQLLIGLDGGYMLDLARRQFEWSVPVFVTSIDFYQGLGDIFFGSANFTLLPSFIVGNWLSHAGLSRLAIYVVCIIEITGAIYFFSRSLELNAAVSSAAAMLMPSLAFPFWWTGALYNILALTPQIVTMTAASLVMAGCFLRFGRQTVRLDWRYGGALLGLLVWFVHAGIAAAVLAGPTLLLVGIAGLLGANSRSEVFRKLALVAVCGVISVGPFLYLLGILLNSVPTVAADDLQDDRTTLLFASILFHWNIVGPAGTLLVLAAVGGAFAALFDRTNRILRTLGITLLTYLCTRLSFWVATVLFDFWRGPSALYFEFFVIPIYAIYAVSLFARVARAGLGRVGLGPPPAAIPILASGVTAAVFVIGAAATTPSSDWGFAYPPRTSPIIEQLRSEVGIDPPDVFRGRVVNLTGRATDRGIGWIDLHVLDAATHRELGSDLRIFGLHHFGIPSLFQYGSTITPAFHAVTTRLLADPRDAQLRGVSVLRRYDRRILAMLGVRMVVTDAPVEGLGPVLSQPVGDRRILVYRVPDANLGTYSPVRVVVLPRVRDVLTFLSNADIDLRDAVASTVPIDDARLTPAMDAVMRFDGVAVTVRARSEGRSILLLPLEYSRCLSVDPRPGSSAPSLFRANLLLTGVIFDGALDTSIRLRSGPFVDPACRLLDLRDLLALGVRDLPAVRDLVRE